MKKQFLASRILVGLSLFIYAQTAFSVTAKPKLAEEKLIITDEVLAKTSYCEPLLRVAGADEVIARKIFINSNNKKLKEYIQEHLYSCFNLLDKSLKGSRNFAKDLIGEYPILFGDLEEPAHSDKEVIISAATSMGKYKYCNLPILELPSFVNEKKFKETLAKVNPFCQKYLPENKIKDLDKDNNSNMQGYYKSFMPTRNPTREYNYYLENNEPRPLNNITKILELIRNGDSDQDWFFKPFKDSSSYAELIIDDRESSLSVFSEKDLEAILNRLEKFDPTSNDNSIKHDVSLALSTIYRLYFENPEDLILKKLIPRIKDKKNIEKLIMYGGNFDKTSQYIGTRLLNDPEILNLFIYKCSPYGSGYNPVQSDFWKNLKPEVFKSKAIVLAPCASNYKDFIAAIPGMDVPLVVKMLDQARGSPRHFASWANELYKNLSEEYKNNKDIVLAMIFTSDTDTFSILPKKFKTNPEIKLHALKYLKDCNQLLEANPDDKTLLMDIYFPENINHDIDFLFGSIKNKKRLPMSEDRHIVTCFSKVSSKVRGDPAVALPIFKVYPGIWKEISEPASLDFEVLKFGAKNYSEVCEYPALKKRFPTLTKNQRLEILKININCIINLPSELYDDGIYKALITLKLPPSILRTFPEKYKTDIKIIEQISAYPSSLDLPPITIEHIEAFKATKPAEDESGEDDHTYLDELYTLETKKKAYDDTLKAYNSDILSFLILIH